MPRLKLPNSVSIQNVGHFLRSNEPFDGDSDIAVLEFHPAWVHLEPIALAMTAAWGAWCRRQGKTVVVENLSRRADYAARMRLFHHLGVDYDPGIVEHEEAGRFLPISQIVQRDQVASVIAGRGQRFPSKSAPIRLLIIAASLSGFSGTSQVAHLKRGGFALHD